MEDPFRILVVDDDPIVLAVAQAILEGLDYSVITHDRGFGATSIVYRERPHVVLMDVMMPGLGGDQLVGPIQQRQWEPDQPWPVVILHSSMEADELERLVKETGAAGAISKMGTRDDFRLAFQRLVESVTPNDSRS